MSDPLDWQPEQIECRCGCGATATTEIAAWRYVVPPPGWIALDSFPPGDDGIYWLASRACAERWQAMRDERYR